MNSINGDRIGEMGIVGSRGSSCPIKEPTPECMASPGLCFTTFLSTLTLLSTTAWFILASDSPTGRVSPFSRDITYIAGYNTDLSIGSVAAMVNTLGSLALMGLSVKLAVCISAPKKIIKIAIPVILGVGAGLGVGLPLPAKCLNITGYNSVDTYSADPCLKTLFSKESIPKYFPNCTGYLYGGTNSAGVARGGLCSNTSVEYSVNISYYPELMETKFPDLDISVEPGYCIFGLGWYPSLTSEWDEQLNYIPGKPFSSYELWKGLGQNLRYMLPTNLTSEKVIGTKNGEKVVSINLTGWTMYSPQYNDDFCIKSYQMLNPQIWECGTEEFKQYYTSTIDPLLIQWNKTQEEFAPIQEECKPWISALVTVNQFFMFFSPLFFFLSCAVITFNCNPRKYRRLDYV